MNFGKKAFKCIIKVEMTKLKTRDALGRCPACTGFEKCGYCLSTLQCVEGNAAGPLDKSPCPSWSYASDGCPGILYPLLLSKT